LGEVSSRDELVEPQGDVLRPIADELRASIDLIKNYAATLRAPGGSRDEDALRRCLSLLIEANAELDELVDQVLGLSQAPVGAIGVEPRPIRLSPLFRTAIGRARTRSPRHRFRLDLPAHLPPVLGDARRLRQLLANLLDNAIKYSPDGGQITISAEAAGSEVVVRISDQGLGISAEDLDHLFEQFYRGRTAPGRHIGGDGLGLAICRGIVEAHGGRIWAESPAVGQPPGQMPGATFHFTVPVATVVRPTNRAVYRMVLGLLLIAGQLAAVVDVIDSHGRGPQTHVIE
jgi:two-component system, OmpR family, phosphate regulon sensor histidine kinase PhoR